LPEHIQISIEELKIAPIRLKALDVCTIKSGSRAESEEAVRALLLSIGITKRAINTAYKVLNGKKAMRVAAIVTATTGRRIEPDRRRGVRARLIGIDKRAASNMYKKLDKYGLANDTVMEALTLATKVASTPDVVAELCASDDPHYTTGYVAVNGPGYIRIPHIKKTGSISGGRVIFVGENTDPDEVIEWLEKVPVIVGSTGTVMGNISVNNIHCRQVSLQK
jgi:6-carboxyhexanoate--CoA ligase